MNSLNKLAFVLFFCIVALSSCKREETQTVLRSAQPDYSITYKKDSIFIMSPWKSMYRFVLIDGEYYAESDSQKTLFFSTKRDTTILIPNQANQVSDLFIAGGVDKMYIGRVEKSPLSHHELFGKSVFVTEFFVTKEKDHNILRIAYYYDSNYRIIGIEKIGYLYYEDK